jgi:uncharacterized integral membrane protein (TIGR00698 family)
MLSSILGKGMEKTKGIVLSSVIGFSALFLANYTPSAINSILLALLFGILVRNAALVTEKFESGIGFTSSKLLELSIIFLAFSIDYTHIGKLGWISFTSIAFVLLLVLLVTFYLASKLNCPGSTGWLVGFGTAICGSSAIAALAPGVSKNKEDVAISMAVVNLFGTLGMIFLPMLLVRLHLDPAQIGFLVGGSLHSVGNVAGAGYAIGQEAGEVALTIKLARVALLSPALIFFNFLIHRKHVKSWKEHFKLPWYLIGFVSITIVSSWVDFPSLFLGAMDTIGKVVLTIAMAAIGLKVSFKSLLQSGKKGLSFGLLLFLLQLLLLTLFIGFIQ